MSQKHNTFGSGKKAMKKTMKTFNKNYSQVDPRDQIKPTTNTSGLMTRPNKKISLGSNPNEKIIKMVREIRST